MNLKNAIISLIIVFSLLGCVGDVVAMDGNRSDTRIEVSENLKPLDVMEAKNFVAEDGLALPYRIFIPSDYNLNKKYPVLLYLHGAGERGNDNNLQLNESNSKIIEMIVNSQEENQQSIIIAPQCPVGQQWVNTPWGYGSYDMDSIYVSRPLKAVEELLSSIKKEYSIDNNRIYVTGISMGGYGTWNLLMRNPEMFAAAIPICGAADLDKAGLLKDMPIWAFHGNLDDVVPVSGSRDMINALKKVGSTQAKYTEYTGVYHDSWINAYKEEGLLTWLFSQSKENKIETLLNTPTYVKSGEDFVVKVGIGGSDESIYAGDITITYDGNLFELNEVEEAVAGIALDYTKDEGGIRSVIAHTEGGINDSGYILKLNFTAKEIEKNTKGSIDIQQANFATVLEGISNLLIGKLDSREILVVSSDNVEWMEDVNGDKLINIADLALVTYYYGISNEDRDIWEEAQAADVNGDGQIDVIDVAQVASKILVK